MGSPLSTRLQQIFWRSRQQKSRRLQRPIAVRAALLPPGAPLDLAGSPRELPSPSSGSDGRDGPVRVWRGSNRLVYGMAAESGRALSIGGPLRWLAAGVTTRACKTVALGRVCCVCAAALLPFVLSFRPGPRESIAIDEIRAFLCAPVLRKSVLPLAFRWP